MGLGSLLLGGFLGYHMAKNRGGRREAGDNQVILRFNTSDTNVLDPFRDDLMVLGEEDPKNQTAIFSYAGGQAAGVLSDYPTHDENGVMQGSFAVLDLDKPVEGDWISVDKSVADAQTTCAFDKATELVAAGDQVSAEPLAVLLDKVKEFYC